MAQAPNVHGMWRGGPVRGYGRVVDLDPRRLTVTGIPPAAWQVLDQYRRRDLAASRAEDREPTIEVADAEAASAGAPFASRQPARGSVDPRHYTPLNGHVRGTAVRLAPCKEYCGSNTPICRQYSNTPGPADEPYTPILHTPSF